MQEEVLIRGNLGNLEKNLVFHWKMISYFTCIFPLVLLFIFLFQIIISNKRDDFFNIETLNSGTNLPL